MSNDQMPEEFEIPGGKLGQLTVSAIVLFCWLALFLGVPTLLYEFGCFLIGN